MQSVRSCLMHCVFATTERAPLDGGRCGRELLVALAQLIDRGVIAATDLFQGFTPGDSDNQLLWPFFRQPLLPSLDADGRDSQMPWLTLVIEVLRQLQFRIKSKQLIGG